MGASLIRFDNHRSLSQSKESKCMWTHGKDFIDKHFRSFLLAGKYSLVLLLH